MLVGENAWKNFGEDQYKLQKVLWFNGTVRPATALTSLALNLILHYFELVPELLLQHYFLSFYLPSTALFWHGSW